MVPLSPSQDLTMGSQRNQEDMLQMSTGFSRCKSGPFARLEAESSCISLNCTYPAKAEKKENIILYTNEYETWSIESEASSCKDPTAPNVGVKRTATTVKGEFANTVGCREVYTLQLVFITRYEILLSATFGVVERRAQDKTLGRPDQSRLPLAETESKNN
ncbi:hypothetical protein EVAR_30414_1 [Eumeta japonica]|uniref:Uncharacterized protein n=1 Tax=Eumeta variegata TaxID=151549 RepID=A0A4C1W5J6_EUMVA|nr:hypothetical protein EVAR_30414_1 [Eumeta japonica]